MICLRQNDVADLNTVMNTSAGMMSYFAKFWRGFYPLLIVELVEKTDSIAVRKVKKRMHMQYQNFPILLFLRILNPARRTRTLPRQWTVSTNSSATYTTYRLSTFYRRSARSMCDTDDIPTLSLALTDYHVLCDAN